MRAEDNPAVPPVWRADAALPGAPRALLPPGLLAAAAHLAAGLGIRRAVPLVRLFGCNCPMDHRAVGHIPPMEVVALDHAGEAFAFANSRHLDDVAFFKDLVGGDRLAELEVRCVLHTDLAQRAARAYLGVGGILQPALEVSQ